MDWTSSVTCDEMDGETDGCRCSPTVSWGTIGASAQSGKTQQGPPDSKLCRSLPPSIFLPSPIAHPEGDKHPRHPIGLPFSPTLLKLEAKGPVSIRPEISLPSGKPQSGSPRRSLDDAWSRNMVSIRQLGCIEATKSLSSRIGRGAVWSARKISEEERGVPSTTPTGNHFNTRGHHLSRCVCDDSTPTRP